MFAGDIAAQRGQMIDLSPQLMLQIMNDRARRADRRRHFARNQNHRAI